MDIHAQFQAPTLQEWKATLVTAYDERQWRQLAADERHRHVVERIGQPLRVKLLYDSYLWRWMLTQYGVTTVARVVELLPGWSHTVAVALESARFSGELTQIDLERPHANRTPFSFPRRWLQQNIFEAVDSLRDAQLIVGNHILDDILICQANASDQERKQYYSSPEHSRASWERLAAHPMLNEWIDATANCLAAIASSLRGGQTLILREYPSTTAVRQEDYNRWTLERKVQEVVYKRLASLQGLHVTRPALAEAPAPLGCRFPESFMVVVKT